MTSDSQKSSARPRQNNDGAAKLRVLDLFCCEGGAGMGYHLAGFDVTGVDLYPQPRYPFTFIQADCLTLEPAWIRRNFDAIHASPPCQFGTALKHAPNAKKHNNLIPATRKLLKATGLPYIIENVEAVARAGHMINPICLCGSMFGLGSGSYQLRRHRYFESNVTIGSAGACKHLDYPVIGIYGGHVRCRAAKHGGRKTRDFVGYDKPAMAAEAMGMPWATMAGMSEAIPPAYTRYLGLQLMQQLSQAEAA